MVSQAAEKIISKSKSSKPEIDPNAERRINSISWLGIVIIILILGLLIGIFIYAIIQGNKEGVNRLNDVRDDYVLMWGDDFSTGTSSSYNVENEKIVLPISSRIGLRQIGSSGQRYPDLERWTLQQSIEPGPTYFTQSVQNAFIVNRKLHSRLLRQSTTIEQDEINDRITSSPRSNTMRRRYEYDFTSSRLISRIATNGGFFNFRLKPPKEPGVRVKISLLPYINSCMNVIGSEYGPWPLCGEITIFEYNSDDNYWRGDLIYPHYPPKSCVRNRSEGEVTLPLHYERSKFDNRVPRVEGSSTPTSNNETTAQVVGTERYPIDNRIQKLSPDQWQIIGLHWTNDCIDWIYNGSVTNGEIKGDIVQSISSKDWYTIALNDGECYCEEKFSSQSINDLLNNNSYRKVASPAPFDKQFNIVIEVTTSDQSTSNTLVHNFNTRNNVVGEVILDWVKLYNRPITSESSTNSLLNIDDL